MLSRFKPVFVLIISRGDYFHSFFLRQAIIDQRQAWAEQVNRAWDWSLD